MDLEQHKNGNITSQSIPQKLTIPEHGKDPEKACASKQYQVCYRTSGTCNMTVK
jgi:hypothetical protein